MDLRVSQQAGYVGMLADQRKIAGMNLGFEEMDEDFFRVYFRSIELAELDVADLRFRSVRTMP
jgi:hypothetical protein